MSLATTSPIETVQDREAAGELLFQPYKLGALTLPHRVVMAPLTRSRASQPGNIPTTLNSARK